MKVELDLRATSFPQIDSVNITPMRYEIYLNSKHTILQSQPIKFTPTDEHIAQKAKTLGFLTKQHFMLYLRPVMALNEQDNHI